jgi:hypothetical protein
MGNLDNARAYWFVTEGGAVHGRSLKPRRSVISTRYESHRGCVLIANNVIQVR